MNNLLPERERALLARIPRHPEAFRPLYEHYFPRVYAYVASRVSSRQEAEDVTATVFLSAIESLSTFEYRGPGAFAAWLFRIAVHGISESYRFEARRPAVPLAEMPDVPGTELLPDEAFAEKEQAIWLAQAVATLSPRRQEVISLRFFGGLRNQEIAAVLDLDERTVASHLCRGLDDLKQLVKQEGVIHE
ncbi:MAG: sigma-70 family RNA polymerase sigma factor [Anaerolineae bacterium]